MPIKIVFLIAKAKTGIKYCGGGNLSYEGVEVIKRVQSAVED